MWYLLLLPVSLCSVHFTTNKRVDICFFIQSQPGSVNQGIDNAFNKTLNALSSLSYTTYQVCGTNYQNQAKDIVEDIAACSCLSDPEVDQVIVYAELASEVLSTLIGSQNECMKLPFRKIFYHKINASEEIFIISTQCKLCYLGFSGLGAGCDSANTANWLTIGEGNSQSDYQVYNVPELGMGVAIYPADDATTQKDVYFCKRINDSPVNPVIFFTSSAQPPQSDQVMRSVNWDRVWKNVKNAAQVVYQVLDLFFKPREGEPRPEEVARSI
ncbi:VP7 [Rotavirus I]|uniref:VP7 n=1 Tax=Rotavirus I TaxID=1637496 RepID=A0A0E3JVA5_9REOV|nr:VP7 [Rotavirus I]AKA63278.1 VP7 [Rotavirus I]